MITRIVKMTFETDSVTQFRGIFETSHAKIEAFPGCAGVALLLDKQQPNVFFTVSRWADEEALEAYRNSSLFKETWRRTKRLFADKPEAWSTKIIAGKL